MPTISLEQFPILTRALMQLRGETPKQIAKATGVRTTTLSVWLSGKENVLSAKRRDLLLHHLGVEKYRPPTDGKERYRLSSDVLHQWHDGGAQDDSKLVLEMLSIEEQTKFLFMDEQLGSVKTCFLLAGDVLIRLQITPPVESSVKPAFDLATIVNRTLTVPGALADVDTDSLASARSALLALAEQETVNAGEEVTLDLIKSSLRQKPVIPAEQLPTLVLALIQLRGETLEEIAKAIDVYTTELSAWLGGKEQGISAEQLDSLQRHLGVEGVSLCNSVVHRWQDGGALVASKHVLSTLLPEKQRVWLFESENDQPESVKTRLLLAGDVLIHLEITAVVETSDKLAFDLATVIRVDRVIPAPEEELVKIQNNSLELARNTLSALAEQAAAKADDEAMREVPKSSLSETVVAHVESPQDRQPQVQAISHEQLSTLVLALIQLRGETLSQIAEAIVVCTTDLSAWLGGKEQGISAKRRDLLLHYLGMERYRLRADVLHRWQDGGALVASNLVLSTLLANKRLAKKQMVCLFQDEQPGEVKTCFLLVGDALICLQIDSGAKLVLNLATVDWVDCVITVPVSLARIPIESLAQARSELLALAKQVAVNTDNIEWLKWLKFSLTKTAADSVVLPRDVQPQEQAVHPDQLPMLVFYLLVMRNETERQIAEATGVRAANISDWMGGKKEQVLSTKRLVRLLHYLGVEGGRLRADVVHKWWDYAEPMTAFNYVLDTLSAKKQTVWLFQDKQPGGIKTRFLLVGDALIHLEIKPTEKQRGETDLDLATVSWVDHVITVSGSLDEIPIDSMESARKALSALVEKTDDKAIPEWLTSSQTETVQTETVAAQVVSPRGWQLLEKALHSALAKGAKPTDIAQWLQERIRNRNNAEMPSAG